MRDQLWPWIGFNLFVLTMLALDLFVFHREAQEVRLTEAAAWSVLGGLVALAFNGGLAYFRGVPPRSSS